MRSALLFVLLLFSYTLTAQTDSLDRATALSNLTLEQLMNIKVISATGNEQLISEAPSTISVITAQQIKERGYEQLQDALRDVPGIDFIHINGYAPTLIYFRGMYGSENLRALLMIDGIAENNIIGSNDMSGPAYDLHAVERIEIIWGPVSALYGANAFGGVINIITKKGEAINGLHVEKGVGSFNTSFERLSLGLRKGKFEFAISGSLYRTDGPTFENRDPNYRGSYVDNAHGFNTTISYYGKKSKTSFGYRDYKTPSGWGTYSNSPTVYLGLPPQGNMNSGIVGVLSRPVRGEQPGMEVSFKRAMFVANEFKVNEKLNLSGRAIYRETGTGDASFIYVTADGRKMLRVPIATYSNRLSAELSATYKPSEKQELSAGVEIFQDNVERGARKFTFDPTVYLIDGKDTLINVNATYLKRAYDIRNNFGGYLQYNLKTTLLNKTNFTLGLRYDDNSYFGQTTTPRIAVVNQPSQNLTFKLQYGTAFRAPTNIEIYQTTDPNFKLKKEKLRAYEFNTIYTVSKQVRLQLNLFRNELTNTIVIGNLSGLNPDKNPGEQTINGVEASTDVIIDKKLSGFLNFTFQDAKGKNYITNFSGYLPGVAKVKGNIGATVHIEDLFIFTLDGNWVGERRVPRTDPYGPVAGYFLTNAVVSTEKIFNNRVSASVNVQNIFNVKWLDPGFRTADGLLYATVLEQPGRSLLFKVTVRLF